MADQLYTPAGADSLGADSSAPEVSHSPRIALRAAVVGTILEYYDFGIYGYMATTIAALFFVKEDPSAALLGTFAAFAVAFFLRVPGGIFFGHIGDKYGRKTALSWTILLMVLATTAIGLLPTYVTLGVWATAAMVLARCLQGFAAGGELSGANAFLAESSPAPRRATMTSMTLVGSAVGMLTASVTALIITSVFTEEQVLAWAWRIPFLLSIPLGFIGIWIRKHVDDSPEFKKLEVDGDIKERPIVELFRTSRSSVFKVMALGAVVTGGYYIASVYAATYLQTVGGHSPQTAYISTTVALLLGMATLPLSGHLSDRYGRKPVLFAGSLAAVILGVPMFMLMAGGSVWQGVLGQSVLCICVQFVNGTSFAAWAEMFKTSVRYTGIAFSNNTVNMMLGGTAPFIATFLVSSTGSELAPAGYFVACALITCITVPLIKETKGCDLSG